MLKYKKGDFMKKIYSTDLYKYLPHSNCKRCREDGCMAFAAKLSTGDVKLSQCAPLSLKEQEKNLTALKDLLISLGQKIR